MATPQTLRNLRPPAMAALAYPQQEEEFQRFLRRVDDISECGSGVVKRPGDGTGNETLRVHIFPIGSPQAAWCRA